VAVAVVLGAAVDAVAACAVLAEAAVVAADAVEELVVVVTVVSVEAACAVGWADRLEEAAVLARCARERLDAELTAVDLTSATVAASELVLLPIVPRSRTATHSAASRISERATTRRRRTFVRRSRARTARAIWRARSGCGGRVSSMAAVCRRRLGRS
jgi:hypothetical protein